MASNDKLVEYNEDGSISKETLKRAMKAYRRRLKLTREDDESRLGHDAMSSGRKSSIVGVHAPEQYPPEVWAALVEKGRLKKHQDGVYEMIEV